MNRFNILSASALLASASASASSSSSSAASGVAMDYKGISDSLKQGKEMTWTVTTSSCQLQSGNRLSPESSTITSTIENWELFYDPRFGPKDYFAVGSEQLIFDVGGKLEPHYQLSTLRVYDDDSATLTVERVDPTVPNWKQTSQTVYSCNMETDITFSQGADSYEKLNSPQEVIASLHKGSRVSYVVDYAKCSLDGGPGMGAIGGSVMHTQYSLDTTSEDDYRLAWNRRTLIKNYQGDGYVYDVVLGSLTPSGPDTATALFSASDISTTDYKEQYVETFNCTLGGSEAGVTAYRPVV